MKTFPFVLIFLFIIGCKKDDNTSSGGGPGGTTAARGTMKYTIDSIPYSYEDNSVYEFSLVTFSSTPSISLYQLNLSFTKSSVSASSNVSLQQISNLPLTAKDYQYLTFNIAERPQFIFTLQGSHNVFSTSTTTTGHIQFTQLDTIVGGYIKGVFAFQNLDLRDSAGTILSNGHALTNGEFNVKIK